MELGRKSSLRGPGHQNVCQCLSDVAGWRVIPLSNNFVQDFVFILGNGYITTPSDKTEINRGKTDYPLVVYEK